MALLSWESFEGGERGVTAIRAQRQQEILAAAQAVFAEEGFHGATMDDIAARAGLAKGTLYLYFSSKRELFLSVLKHRFEEMRRTLREVIYSGDDFSAQVEAVIRAHGDFCRENKEFFQILEEFKGDLGAGVRKTREDILSLFMELIDLGIKTGQVRPIDRRQGALALLGILDSVALDWLLRGDRGSPNVDGLAELYCWGVMGREGAGQE
jgi:TetR/AcrR family fatty acid metabolism transcriptional regulator